MDNRRPDNKHSRIKPAVLFSLLTAVLLTVSMACEVGPTVEWVKTVSLKTPTPDASQTAAAQLTATQMVGKVGQMVGKKEVLVALDPLGERDISDVKIDVIQAGNTLLVETNDPKNRYLPDAELVPADREAVQQVDAQQVNIAWTWGFKRGGSVDAGPLLGESLGSMPLGSVLAYLADNWQEGGVNIVVQALDSYKDEQPFTVYRTAGKHTFILIAPQAATGRSPGLAAPSHGPLILDSFAVFSFSSIPNTSLLTYINAVTNAVAGNYIGATATDVPWAELKVREIDGSLPEGYTPPKGVTQEIVNWIDFDPTFVSSLRMLGTEQKVEPCVKAEQLNKVIKQKPAAGKSLNGLKKKVVLSVCNQVVSQKKYETLIFQSPTATLTPTLTRTFTPRPTIRATSTITLTRTATKAPSSTSSPSGPTQTARSSATAGKATSSASTATQKANATTSKAGTLTATHTTPTRTNTPVPAMVDEFVTSSEGYDSNVWNVVDTGDGRRSWPREERMNQEVNADDPGIGDLRLVSKKSCLMGEAQFSMRSSEAGSGYIQAGWANTDLTYGVYLESDPTDTNNTKFIFTVLADGAALNQNVVLNSSSNGGFTTYRITWAYQDDVNIKASLNVDNSNIHDYSLTATKPDNRLNFILRTAALDNPDPTPNSAYIEMDYVHIYSNTCS